MSKDFYYKGNVSVNARGKRTYSAKIDYGKYCNLNELENIDSVKSLACGESFILKDNVIEVLMDDEGDLVRLKNVLHLSEMILHEDFKMDCVDEFGIHRQVVAESVKVYQDHFGFVSKRCYQIKFDVQVEFSWSGDCLLEKRIKRDSLVKIESVKMMLESLKLQNDYPAEYRLFNIDGVMWIGRLSKRKRDLWNVLAKPIWNSINGSYSLIKFIQKTCPDKELRDRLQKIELSNIIEFENFQSEKLRNETEMDAIRKLLELQEGCSDSDGDEIKKKVGLYIVSQIRANPQKYVKSYFSSIRDCAKEVLGESSL